MAKRALPAKGHWSCLLKHQGSTDVRHYTLSQEQLKLLNYPQDMSRRGAWRAPDRTHERAARVLAIDCEMVLGQHGRHLLARVAVVAWRLGEDACGEAIYWGPTQQALETAGAKAEVLLDLLVRPDEPIVDYVTEHSGIDEALMARAEHSYEQALATLAEHISAHDILCGHGLEHDLRILRLLHDHILDTQALYPHHDGPPSKNGLKRLSLEILKRHIQVQTHCPIDDATAALDLARQKVSSAQGVLLWRPLEPKAQTSFEQISLALALEKLELDPEEVLCAYVRGSRAVGTARLEADGRGPSDWDLVIVMRDKVYKQDSIHLRYGRLEAVLYDEQTWRGLIHECCIWALECVFAPRAFRLLERIDFGLEFEDYRDKLPQDIFLAKLRRSVSYESGRQWTKAKRYLERHQDRYRCRKGLFIALRFLVYGIDVAREGLIIDIQAINPLWEERLRDDPSKTWAQLMADYGPLYQSLRAEFKALTPKLPRYAGFRAGLDASSPSPSPQPTQVEGDATRALAQAEELAPLAPGALLVQRWLRSLSPQGQPEIALAMLQGYYHMGVARHARYPNLVQLRYSPRTKPKDDPLARQCRGVILDMDQDWACVARGFDRFFELRAGLDEAQLDWESAVCEEKLDGSLAMLYWYDGQWQVASSRRPDASGLMCLRDKDGALPFEQLFWQIWRAQGYTLPPAPSLASSHAQHQPRRCFIFELISRRHPIVVRHAHEELVLLGVRDLESGQELDPEPFASALGTRRPKRFALPVAAPTAEPHAALLQALIQRAEALDASQDEGFVVVDAHFNRVKVKSSDYTRMAWMFPLCPTRAHINDKRLLMVIMAEEQDDFKLYCPEYAAQLSALEATYEAFLTRVDDSFTSIQAATQDLEPQAFALRAKAHHAAPLLFAMRKHEISAATAAKQLKLTTLLKLLDLARDEREDARREHASTDRATTYKASDLGLELARWRPIHHKPYNNKTQA